MSALRAMMVDVTPETTTTTPLVGRSREVAQLSELAGLDSTPRAGSVLVAGDAGVGKTRLLAELRDLARDAGWRVLAGHCLDFGDSALPYLPFSEIFGRLGTDSPALIESLAQAHPAVRRLLPGRRLLSDAEQVPSGPMDRGDLFESVHAAFEQLGDAAALLVLVEDVHWADQSTREMLSFLFARQFAAPVVVVASYRSDDLHRRHPLRRPIAEWSRLPRVRRLALAPLGNTEIRTLISSLQKVPLPEADVRRILERAGGNAFFTEELVAASSLGDPGGVPPELADLLLVRLDPLSESAAQVA
ncbi:MAG: AAA family ATPase, partial [Pseudonocardiaceae bacterium]